MRRGNCLALVSTPKAALQEARPILGPLGGLPLLLLIMPRKREVLVSVRGHERGRVLGAMTEWQWVNLVAGGEQMAEADSPTCRLMVYLPPAAWRLRDGLCCG